MDQELKLKLVDLNLRYVEIVDSREVEKWPDLFADESSYQVISRENYERGMGVSFVLDDSKDRIKDRVTIIRKIWAGHYNDYQSRHLISVINIQPSGGEENSAGSKEMDTFLIKTNLAVYTTETDGTSKLLAVGEYCDTVVFQDGIPKFKEKLVILDTALLSRYFVYPL